MHFAWHMDINTFVLMAFLTLSGHLLDYRSTSMFLPFCLVDFYAFINLLAIYGNNRIYFYYSLFFLTSWVASLFRVHIYLCLIWFDLGQPTCGFFFFCISCYCVQIPKVAAVTIMWFWNKWLYYHTTLGIKTFSRNARTRASHAMLPW